jgi:hypothetical protein
MPRMFVMHFHNLKADPGSGDIAFDFLIQNRAPIRQATIQSYVFELWLVNNANRSQAVFLSPLSMSLVAAAMNEPRYKPHEERDLRLIWHCTPTQLQQVERVRNGAAPDFQVRSQIGVNVQSLKPDGTPHGPAQFVWENLFDATNNYPANVSLDQSVWARLLEELGFRHIILQELSMPTFPPGFERAQAHLADAWAQHRSGKEDGTLQSCYKAFECLGFSLSGQIVEREALLKKLMDGQEKAKTQTIEKMWNSLSELFHLGRHDRSEPVHLTHKDGELAVVSATILLKYLAEP